MQIRRKDRKIWKEGQMSWKKTNEEGKKRRKIRKGEKRTWKE